MDFATILGTYGINGGIVAVLAYLVREVSAVKNETKYIRGLLDGRAKK